MGKQDLAIDHEGLPMALPLSAGAWISRRINHWIRSYCFFYASPATALAARSTRLAHTGSLSCYRGVWVSKKESGGSRPRSLKLMDRLDGTRLCMAMELKWMPSSELDLGGW